MLIGLLAGTSFLCAAFAQDAPLQVGVSDLPPFAIQKDEQWDGLGVQLWRKVADDLNITYDFVQVPPEDLVTRVVSGELDLGITATATAATEAEADFSYPYYTSSLGVATPRTQSLWETARGLFTPRFFRVALFLASLLLVVGSLIWFLERRTNKEQFGGDRNLAQGIGAGFWWAGVTMTTIGYGDKTPITLWGRAVALLWMLIAMGVTASLTATIVAVVEAGGRSLSVPGDLWEMQVGSTPDTPAAEYLREEGINFQAFDTPLEGLRALRSRDIEAFVSNEATLQFLRNENKNLIFQLSSTNAKPQHYAFVLPQGSDVRERLNAALLTRLNSRSQERLLERYLPSSSP